MTLLLRRVLAIAALAALPGTLWTIRSAQATETTEEASGWDQSVYFAARLLPRGAAIGATIGYGHALWGEPGRGKILYGYVRPSTTLQTSLLLSRTEVGVDVFPISFFGVRVGAQGSDRMVRLDTVDCNAAYCRGFEGFAYIKPQLLMGYGPFSALAAFHVSWFATPDTTLRYFGEDVSNLAGNASGDRLYGWELAAQYKISPTSAAGAYATTDHMIGSGATNQMLSGFGKYLHGPWTFTLGAGAYQSTTQNWGFTCFGVVGWTGTPSIGLR